MGKTNNKSTSIFPWPWHNDTLTVAMTTSTGCSAAGFQRPLHTVSIGEISPCCTPPLDWSQPGLATCPTVDKQHKGRLDGPNALQLKGIHCGLYLGCIISLYPVRFTHKCGCNRVVYWIWEQNFNLWTSQTFLQGLQNSFECLTH